MKIQLLSVLILTLCFLSGCSTFTGPGSDSIAHIVIKDADVSQVRKAVMEVFGDEYYTPVGNGYDKITFERPGTGDDRLRYGLYQQSLVMQVEVEISSLGERDCLVQADAYALRGSSRMPQKVLFVARRPYQNILKKVNECVLENSTKEP